MVNKIFTHPYLKKRIHFYQDPDDPTKRTWLDANEMSAPMGLVDNGVMWEIKMGHFFSLEPHVKKDEYLKKKLHLISLEGLKFIVKLYQFKEMMQFIAFLEKIIKGDEPCN